MAAFESNENQLKFEEDNGVIQDYQSTNTDVMCYFLYLLSGIDKLHDFGDSSDGFKKIYPLIAANHFYNTTFGIKTIENQPSEEVNVNLTHKVQALHKMIDFMSYEKPTYDSPILNAPLLTFLTQTHDKTRTIVNYTARAPAAILPVKITSLAGVANDAELKKYKTQIPPERDVILYFTGRSNEFENAECITALKKILDIENKEYISKDAFPMDGDILSDMLGDTDEKPVFNSYLSKLVDPATQGKTTLSVTKTIKLFYCKLQDDKKLLLTADLKDEKVTLSFKLFPGNGSVRGLTPFVISENTPTPSIMDVIIYMFWDQHNGADSEAAKQKALKKTFGAKIVNLFKKDRKKQNEIARELNSSYFSKLYNAIPSDAKNSLENRQLIAVAAKTVADQSYLLDALIDESKYGKHNIHGPFVTTVDSFLFDQIVHGKNANAIFASKSNGTVFNKVKAKENGSNYQMAIYLKPLLGHEADKFKAEFEERKLEMIGEHTRVTELFTVNMTQVGVLIGKFEAKQKDIAKWLVDIFDGITVAAADAGRRVRIPKSYTAPGSRSQALLSENVLITAHDVSNLYYSACYLLQYMIKCIISLKEVSEFDIDKHSDENIENVNIIKSMIGKYDDANEYYTETLEDIKHNYANNSVHIPINEQKGRGLYEYLAQTQSSADQKKGDQTDLGFIIPRMGQNPDFQSIRNTLNMNKYKLESELDFPLPTTIGFSKCYVYIKQNVLNYFNMFNRTLFVGGGASGQMVGGTDDITEEEFKESIKSVFPLKEEIAPVDVDEAIARNSNISAIDNYEMLFLLKQLFYEKNEEDDFLEDVDSGERRGVLGLEGGGKKSDDDYYETVYELSVESGLWDNIKDFIEPEAMVNIRKLKEIRAQKAKTQPQIDLSKLRMKTGLGPNVQPLVPDNGGQWSEPVGVFGGKRGTKTMKSRKPSTTITKKRRYVTKTARRKKTKNANRSKKNKTRRKRHY